MIFAVSNSYGQTPDCFACVFTRPQQPNVAIFSTPLSLDSRLQLYLPMEDVVIEMHHMAEYYKC